MSFHVPELNQFEFNDLSGLISSWGAVRAISIAAVTGVGVLAVTGGGAFLCGRGRVTPMLPDATFHDGFDAQRWTPTAVACAPRRDTVFISMGSQGEVYEASLMGRRLFILRKAIRQQGATLNGIALNVSERLMAVADTPGNRVLVYARTGDEWHLDREISVPSPFGLAFLGKELFATSLSRATVLNLSLAAPLESPAIADLPLGRLVWPTGLSRWHNDKLAVCDAYSGYITIMDRTLKVVGSFGGNGPPLQGLNMPFAISEDDGGHGYVFSTYNGWIYAFDHLKPERSCILQTASAPATETGIAQLSSLPVRIDNIFDFTKAGLPARPGVMPDLPVLDQPYSVAFGRLIPCDARLPALPLSGNGAIGPASTLLFPFVHALKDGWLIYSPQSREAFYLSSRRSLHMITVSGTTDWWPDKDGIVSYAGNLDLEAIADAAEQKLDQFARSLQNQSFRRALQGLTGRALDPVAAFASQAGRAFANAMLTKRSSRKLVVRDFISAVHRAEVPLTDLCLATMWTGQIARELWSSQKQPQA